MNNSTHQLLATQSRRFPVDADRLWFWTANPDRYAQWFPGVVAIESLSNGPLRPGFQMRETVALVPGLHARGNLTVRECRQPHRLQIDGTLPLLKPTVAFVIDDVPGGAILRWSMYTRQHNPVVARLLTILVRPMLQRRLRKGLDHLGQLVSSEQSRSARV
ncbi:MAG: SRPBCC family protein [Candidatus Dadabacteria bacterium]|nr:MAG: SRPBCC family protein [Candidatus Dadabacteria bacterium]